MRKLVLIAVSALATAAFMASPASAAGHWKFNLVNASKAQVTGFKTKENGEWSASWLDQKVAPGDEFEMDFGHDDGDCTVRTRIDFSDDTYVDADIDYCHAATITVNNDGITWK